MSGLRLAGTWAARAALITLFVWVLVQAIRLALGHPYTGPDGDLRFANLIAPLRTYLFRLALTNTLVLLLGVGGAALFLGGWLARLGSWTAQPAIAALLLTPWLLADPLAGLLWRPVANALDATASAPAARLAVGLVWLWRLAPLVAFILAHSRGRARFGLAWVALALSMLLDAGSVLLLTGGEPFNASHTWASWTLSQLWTSRAWAYAAVMAGGLGLAAAVVMVVGLGAARRVTWVQQTAAAPFALWAVALLWTLPPWLVWGWHWLANGPLLGLMGFARAGGLGWLLISLLVLGLAVATTALLSPALPRRPSWLTPVAAAGLLPVLPVLLAYARYSQAGVGRVWLLGLLLGGVAAGGLWRREGLHSRWVMALVGVALVMPRSFALALVMQVPQPTYPLDLGVALVLGDVTVFPGATAVGVMVGGALAWATARLVLASIAASQR